MMFRVFATHHSFGIKAYLYAICTINFDLLAYCRLFA